METVEILEPIEFTATETISSYECGYGVSCNGANDGFIDLNVTGGYNCENYTFNWDGPNGFNSSDQTV